MPWRPTSPLSRTASPARTDVGLAALDDLGVAGDDLHAGDPRRHAHRRHHPLERRNRQPFFQNEARAEPLRPRPAHGEIVDRAMHGERADVTAGKKQRAHHVRIGREREPRAGRRRGQERAVVPRIERRVAKRRREHLVDQLLREPPATAMGHLNLLLSGQRHRTTERGGIG
jgi:hypothetical protein